MASLASSSDAGHGRPCSGRQPPRSDRRDRPDRPLGGLIVQTCCRDAGLDPTRYAGHSLRAGFCTAAALASKPNWQIRKRSGHKTDVMLNRYIRDGRLFADHPLEGLL